MKHLITKILKWLHLIEFDVLSRTSETYPVENQIASGELIFVIDAGIEKWACLKCPGGCGATIPLSLNPNRRPRWAVTLDWFQRPTVKPSVHQKNGCGCHFWITKGRIDWCKDGKPHSN
jgi:hypothetical protein